jgi:subtilisin family serine protease
MRPSSLLRLTLVPALLLVVALPRPALARVGDVIALVPASSVADAPQGGARTTASLRSAVTDAALTSALSRADLDVAAVLGPSSAAWRSAPGAVRMLRLTSTRTGFDAAAAARDLVASGAVRAAMVDRAMTLAATLPNDTMLVNQFYIDGPGDIHLPEAWDIAQGSASVVIGILDTGTDIGHEDIAGHVYTNPGEIAGNGIDDDNNGYIDDVHGWDFGDGDNDANPGPLFDPDGIDEGFHGTAVASVAAAVTNNTVGIAGASWYSTIMPLKGANSDGQLLTSAAGEGMLYAAAMGVDVLNMSFGAADPDSALRAFFQNLVNADLAADVLCVASAGNEGSSVEVVPGANDGVLCVGSIDANNTRSTFSNFGPWVDVCATGETMFAAIARNYPVDEISQIIYAFFFGWDEVHPYMFVDGTSFSAPLTAGVCAMVRARFPGATAVGVMNHVKLTGDVIVFDHPIGTKVNAFQALAQTLDAPGPGALPADAGFRLLPARPTPFASTTTLSFTLPAPQRVRLTVVNAAGRRVRTLIDEDRQGGGNAAVWDGADDSGRSVPPGLYFGVLEGNGRRAVTRLVRID